MIDITYFLYNTISGKTVLKLLTAPIVSRICGAFCDCPLSKPLIEPFIRKNAIDMSEFFTGDFKCFNDCFARRIKPGKRPFSSEPSAFVSCCDGLLTVYETDGDTVIPVKQSVYSIARLLHSRKLSGGVRKYSITSRPSSRR